MQTRALKILVVLLAVVIIVLGWLLWTIPAPAKQAPASTTSVSSTTEPLDKSVVVTTPAPNASVPQSFTVAGEAPGPWFFEAVFPIKVFDSNDNTIGVAQGRAQGDWTTTALVTFTATVTVDSNFHGPANLVLLKDNPSGLPQNDDSLEIPIVIQ